MPGKPTPGGRDDRRVTERRDEGKREREGRDRDDHWRHHWHHHHHRWWWEHFGPWSLIGGPAGVASAVASASAVDFGGSPASAGASESLDLSAMVEALRPSLRDQREADSPGSGAEQAAALEDDREQALETKLRRSLNNPPVTEITSAEALNTILDYMKSFPDEALAYANGRLDQDGLKHIRVAGGKGSNLGVFKKDGGINWCPVLKDDLFATQRRQINKLARELVASLSDDEPVDRGTLKRLSQAAEQLQAKLTKNAKEFDADEYIEAKRFLRSLDASIVSLGKAGAGAPGAQLRARTAGALVRDMAREGLRFAPAAPGDEDAYVALHTALVNACDRIADASASRK
jgi:hypothetical protein